MSLITRHERPATSIRHLPSESSAFPLRRFASGLRFSSPFLPRNDMYGLAASSLLGTDSNTPPSTIGKSFRAKPAPVENHEMIHPRILLGREPAWAKYYELSVLWGDIATHWSVHVLDHLEQTFPLQPIVTLTPRNKVLRLWEAHIGLFDITVPALLERKAWLLPQAGRQWWSEGYSAQLDRCFPREDIVFLLHRAEDIVSALKAGEEDFRALKENLYWLMSDNSTAPSLCSSLASTSGLSDPTTSSHSSKPSPPQHDQATSYRIILKSHSVKVSSLRTTISAAHRLPPLLVVIRALLGYLRARARHESAAIARREKEGTNTLTDSTIIECMIEMDGWHIAPEVRLEQLENAGEEWFIRGEGIIRELGRLADLIERRLPGF